SQSQVIKASPDQLLRSLTSPNRSSEPPKPNSYPNSQWQQILKRTPETFKSDGEAERLSGDSGNRRPVAAPSRARTLPPRVEEPEQDDLDVEEDEEEDEEDIGEEEQDGQQERRAVSRAQAVDSGKYGLIRDPKTRQVLSECAIEQRVRRACTAGKKKQALGGPSAVQLYKDSDNREALTEMLIAANFQKGSFRAQVTKFVERERNKENKISAGWYTEAAMASVLKMTASDIKDVVEYTKDKPDLRRQGLGKVRKYKYNPKKLQHYVESDWSTTLKDTTRVVSKWENTRAGEELPADVDDAIPAMPNVKNLGFQALEDPSAAPGDDDKAKRMSDEDLLETVEKAMTDLLTRIAKLHDTVAKLRAPYNPEPNKAHERYAQQLEKSAESMESSYDTLSDLLAQHKSTNSTPKTPLKSAVKDAIKKASALPQIREIEKKIRANAPAAKNAAVPKNAAKAAAKTKNGGQSFGPWSAPPAKEGSRHRAERNAFEELRAAGFTLDVEIDTIKAGPDETSIPWVDPFKMVSALAECDKLDLIYPEECDLLEFWRRFSKIFPDHWVFEAASASNLNLGRTLPFYSHGDEGRGKRKKGILLWSMRGAVGQGSQLFNSLHSTDDRARRMGDNPFLSKVGHLLRNYARVEKKIGDVAGHGICWVCMAGTPSIPFEN
ncbi:unnamed protein product, partial [Symbiodinium sp. KB8]